MIKEFVHDLMFEDEIEDIEILSSSLNNDFLECELKCKCKDLEKIEKCKIPLKDKMDITNYNDYIFDLIDIDCSLENSQILLKGKIDYWKKEKLEDKFSIDPFKQSLLKSFISFKRNKEEVDVISTLDKEIIPYQDLEIEEDNNIEFINEEKEEVEDLNVSTKAKNKVENDNDVLIKDNFVSSFFYYRLTNEENINDIIKKFNISLDDFYRYNKKSEYKENSLIRIKKHEK